MISYPKLGTVGRLGNQMFQIAATIGIAIRNGHDYAFPYWKNLDHAFPPESAPYPPSTEDIDVQAWFENKLPLCDPSHCIEKGVGWGYQDVIVHPYDNVGLYGHMQSEKYFEKYSDIIRRYFTFDENKLPSHIGSFISYDSGNGEAFSDGKTVGIHVRFGDYVQKNGYHPVQTLDYYKAAMQYFEKDSTWTIFSDDTTRAREMFAGIKNCIFLTGNHYMTDLYLMTQCDHFIIANSTYSWWGAWLIENENKKIIAPKNWFGPEANGLSADDIYCKDWIIV